MANVVKTKKKTVKKKAVRTAKENRKKVMTLVCTLIARGKSLVAITSSNIPTIPCYETVRAWLAEDDKTEARELSGMYARAKEDQAEYLAEEIISIADDSSEDEIFTEDGKRVCNNEFVQRSKLRVDARKWVAAKLLPRRYGDRVFNEVTGKDGEKLFPLSPADAMAQLIALNASNEAE